VYFAHQKQGQFIGAGPENGGDYSEKTAHLIDKEIRQIIDEQYEKAVKILRSSRDILDRAAGELLESEVIEGQALKKLSEAVAERTGLSDVSDADSTYNPQQLAA
jgi:cell division protease FtsH